MVQPLQGILSAGTCACDQGCQPGCGHVDKALRGERTCGGLPIQGQVALSLAGDQVQAKKARERERAGRERYTDREKKGAVWAAGDDQVRNWTPTSTKCPSSSGALNRGIRILAEAWSNIKPEGQVPLSPANLPASRFPSQIPRNAIACARVRDAG